jgi:hypothetical protein
VGIALSEPLRTYEVKVKDDYQEVAQACPADELFIQCTGTGVTLIGFGAGGYVELVIRTTAGVVFEGRLDLELKQLDPCGAAEPENLRAELSVP